jgi:hypothetical protein
MTGDRTARRPAGGSGFLQSKAVNSMRDRERIGERRPLHLVALRLERLRDAARDEPYEEAPKR